MKFKKRSKILAAAIALLGFSTAASITGTVAWFTASNVVSASGMYVMAEKEDGIVMANEHFDKWATAVEAYNKGEITDPEDSSKKVQAGFVPTSTANAEKWVHAGAEDAADATAIENSYHEVSPAINESGVYKATINDVDKNIYLLNTFYLKSSSTATITGDLYSYVKAEVVGTSNSAALNRALRVLIKYGTDVNIYAPITDATLSYTVVTSVTESPYAKTTQAVTAKAGETTNLLKSGVTIPANVPGSPNVNTFPINVYAYFEGEDKACFSNNITATLDKLQILVKFGTSSNLA